MKNILKKWFDNQHSQKINTDDHTSSEAVDWSRIIPFIAIHLACFAVIWVGVSTTALVICLLSYLIRMFAITAFYHRYFSHKTFKTSRTVQAIFAMIGATATQRGPLWWAAHHRHHHLNSDTEADTHSPQAGFLHSHMHWFLQKKNFATDLKRIPDLNKFPELRFVDRYDILFPVIYATFLFALGYALNAFFPALQTSSWQILIWGYFISTVLLAHITFFINSLAHVFGRKAYETGDNSRNSFLLAVLTLGEGWHNNHHTYPGSVKQGFHWWQIDVSYYLIKLMEKLGLVWDLKYPNAVFLEKKKIKVKQ